MRVEVQKMINSTVEENSKKLHREINQDIQNALQAQQQENTKRHVEIMEMLRYLAPLATQGSGTLQDATCPSPMDEGVQDE